MTGRLSDKNIFFCKTSYKLIISSKQKIAEFPNFYTESIGELHAHAKQATVRKVKFTRISGDINRYSR